MPEDFVEKIPTKQLLKIRNQCYPEYDWTKDSEFEGAIYIDQFGKLIREPLRFNIGVKVTLKELREELSTREHVPNKLEARQIRKDKAKKH